MIDLSRFSHAALCLRIVRLELRLALVALLGDALGDHVTRLAAESRAMQLVLQQQVVEAAELRRRLANVTVLSALDALSEAPGWAEGAPSLDAFAAHADAHPFEPEPSADLGPGDTSDALWAALHPASDCPWIFFVHLSFGEPRALEFTGYDRQWFDPRELGADCRWLPLTADGKPLDGVARRP